MREWLRAAGIVLLACLLVLLGWWARGQVDAYHAWLDEPIVEGEAPPPLSVSVRPGDTFWSIANEFYDKRRYDLRKVVWAIGQMNPDLDPGRLQPYEDVVYLPRFEEVR